VQGGCREARSETVREFHLSPDFVRTIKSKRRKLVGYVACIEAKRNVYSVFVAKPER
jgi:hypothetical protein